MAEKNFGCEPQAIRSELQRILSSPEFDASDRNRRFLEYVVEETLAGRDDRIKAYSIATSVFGRGENFDPQQDAIVLGGTHFPTKTGDIPEGRPTPTETLDLQPGELVRVKPHKEILRTLNVDRRNRGMGWDAEMVPYCGGTYAVLKRVSKIIDERTGTIRDMKNPCIILDSVVCQAKYARCRMFCPRSIHPYWREIWLERVDPRSSRSEGAGSIREA